MSIPEHPPSSVLGHFVLNYRHIIIDEIALEGLEGITLDLLWRRVALRISAPVTEKMKIRFWKNILESKDIAVYQLPEPLPNFELRDRFTVVDPDTGNLQDPTDYLDGPYEYCPVLREYGSSKYFTTRHLISSQQLLEVSYEKIEVGYGNTLVLVASIEKRWQALASHVPIAHLQLLTPIQYCLLELIGKSRDNGQMTTGTTNLTNIVKEPKNLFYQRKCLKNLDLVKVVCVTQSMGGRGVKSLLLRLIRFHKPMVLSVPKVGKIHKVMEYLRGCPNYSAKAEILLSMRFFTQPQTKKIRKNNNVFEFFDQDDDGEPSNKKKKLNPKKRKCISIVTKSDESSQSDEETSGEPVKCRFNIGVSLIRQAYELFLETGLKGLTQIELGQALGIEFYTTRMICKIFKEKNLVREFFEDKGKQRISRYVAVVAGLQNTDYAEEKNKFLEHIQSNSFFQLGEEIGEKANSPEMILPDNGPDLLDDLASDSMKEYESTHITELTVSNDEKRNIKSIIDSRKSLTLRQLKFGNGIIKIVNARQCVTGLQTLSNLVGKEVNEPPMVSKALKGFLRKLVAAGQIKVFKVRWPGRGNELNYMNLICAPHIKITDPIVRAKYKEVHIRALAKRKVPKKDTSEGSTRPLSMFVNPRYMKIQKLHEVITKLTYFDPLPNRINEIPGFLSVTDLMPEMTVKFAISNMSVTGMAEIAHLKIEDHHFDMKLKEAPPEISHGIMKCKSLKNALRTNLKALGMYGLIQLVYQPNVQTEDYFNSTLTAFLFYVNRNASIIKTTGIWPRDCDMRSLEKRYHFETFEDVKKYWRDVYDISIDTTIRLQEPRTKKYLTPPVRRENEVYMYDNGARYGDGKGPCGLDSCFYLEIARLWRTYYVREPKPSPQPKPPKKPVIKIPKLAKSKKKAMPKKKRPPKVVNPVMKLKTVTRGRKRIPEATVTWSKEEDDIIVMCLVAMAIASPSSQPGSLRVRNIVAKDILSLKDEKKTQSICHRRVLMLQLNPSLMHEKDNLLNEMRRRRHLIYKYEGLIKKLRVRHSTNMSKYMNEARIPIMELVWLIWKVSKSETYNQRVPCVAVNVDNFYENFTITPSTANKMYNIYKSPDLAMLREAVFLSIMLTFNNEIKSDAARKIHSIFKKHPESNLRTVVEQLRRSGAVSAKEKLFNNQMHRLHLEDLASSAYKVSATYLRRWIGRLNSEFAVSLSKILDSELQMTNIKGCAEINCILCELQALGCLEMKTAVKPAVVEPPGFSTDQINVIDLEKHKLNSGSVTWQKKRNDDFPWTSNTVSSLYKDLDYEPMLEALQKSAVVCLDTDLKKEYDVNDAIILHLEEKGDSGASFKELQEITRHSCQDLVQRLHQLETEDIVKRVGLQDNVIILLKYIKNWALKVENKYIIITPWLNLDFKIRHEILLEWTGAIVNKVFEYPGCSIAFLSDTFELITCRALQDACMFLEYAKCISLKVVKCKTPDLFSDEDVEPETSEFNVFESTENICIFPLKNSISRYVYLRKVLLERHVNK